MSKFLLKILDQIQDDANDEFKIYEYLDEGVCDLI